MEDSVLSFFQFFDYPIYCGCYSLYLKYEFLYGGIIMVALSFEDSFGFRLDDLTIQKFIYSQFNLFLIYYLNSRLALFSLV